MATGNTKKETNPKDRAGTNRVDLSLFPGTAIALGALGMTVGNAKYGGYNFRISKVKASVYYAALMRHLIEWFNGESIDPETNIPHIAAILANAAIIADATVGNFLIDDRPPSISNEIRALVNDLENMTKHIYDIFPDGPERLTEIGKNG